MSAVACWQCGAAVTGLFCPQCQALQAPPAEYFRLLGIEHRLALSDDELQRRFYELSRQLHPDRFTRRSPTEQQHSLEASAVLNDAYRTLRDPVGRAEYVLKENGFDVVEQRSADVPPELLEEVFELNMALEEMRSGDEDARPALVDAEQKFKGLQAEVDAQMQQAFLAYDNGHQREQMLTIRGLLNRRRYLSNLVQEVARTLHPA